MQRKTRGGRGVGRVRKLLDWVDGGELVEALVSTSPCAARNPELVPQGYDSDLMRSRWARSHLHWMEQKDALDQDMYLLGMHGPLRRWLSFAFCERTGELKVLDCFRPFLTVPASSGHEMEYLALTQDTTESVRFAPLPCSPPLQFLF
jgi:hypothetical protein